MQETLVLRAPLYWCQEPGSSQSGHPREVQPAPCCTPRSTLRCAELRGPGHVSVRGGVWDVRDPVGGVAKLAKISLPSLTGWPQAEAQGNRREKPQEARLPLGSRNK